MKTLGRKMMIILASALFGFLGLWFLLATCLTIPGQGLESLKFIKSVEKEIDRLTPEGSYLVFAKDGLPTYNALISTYEAEAQSTVISAKISDDKKEKKSLVYQITAFADDWAKGFLVSDNAAVIENDEDGNPTRTYFDLHDIGLDLIEMDKAVSRKFYSESFVTAGIAFFYGNGNSTSEIFGKNLKDLSKMQEQVMDQDAYNKSIDGGLTGFIVKALKVNSTTYGTYIANNKVWFLQQMWDEVYYLLSDANARANLYNPDDTLITADKFKSEVRETSLDDIKLPNYTGSLHLLQAGVVMTYMTIVWAAIIIPLGTLIIVWNRKN